VTPARRATGVATATAPLPSAATTGTIPIAGLMRFWARTMAGAAGDRSVTATEQEGRRDRIMLSVFGIGLEEAITHLARRQPTFADFEGWILSQTGGAFDHHAVARFNRAIGRGRDEASPGQPASEASQPIDESALRFFATHGYIVLRSAIERDHARWCEREVWTTIGASPDDRSSWSVAHPLRQNIMVQRFRGEPFEMNRRNPRIRAAFEQLYGRRDIWPIADRLGFNPPSTEERTAAPMRLHWDAELTPPIPMLLQGLIYLNDVEASQGAFSCIAGFHHRIDDWLRDLPTGRQPSDENLDALGRVFVGGHAGDMVIWHQALPHGASLNRGEYPRIVQYLTYLPLE
jgi:hypothetical protein